LVLGEGWSLSFHGRLRQPDLSANYWPSAFFNRQSRLKNNRRDAIAAAIFLSGLTIFLRLCGVDLGNL
jgi:hypothetical protein